MTIDRFAVTGPRLVLATVALFTAWAPTAQAGLITRQVNHTLTAIPDGPNNFFDLDVDLNGTTDFTFTTIIALPQDPSFAAFAVVEAPFGTINGAVIDAFTGDGFPAVSRLSSGDSVSSADQFFNASFDQGNLFFVTAFDPPSGNFDDATGFIGLRFAGSSGETFFGFAQVTVNDLFAAQDPLAVTIGLVGYESVAGAPAQIPDVPEPTSALLLGAALLAALPALRGKRRPGAGDVVQAVQGARR
jgi:hypothetical protein